MCSPAIATGVIAAGSYYSAQGQMQQGESQNQYYRYLADTTEKQADAVMATAGRQEDAIQDQGASEFKNLKKAEARFEGAQTASMAANGVIGGVTAEDVAADTIDKAKLDEAAIRYNADVKSWEVRNNAKMNAWDLRNQAAQQRVAGANAKRAGEIGAVSTLLGGAGAVASNWTNWGKTSGGGQGAAPRGRGVSRFTMERA